MANVCSHCGAPIGRRALACRECGSDVETGWSPLVGTESFGTGSFDELEYEKFIESEFGPRRPNLRRAIALGTVGLVVLLVLLIAFL